MASSRVRAEARATIRLATLAQAIKSTTTPKPSITRSMLRGFGPMVASTKLMTRAWTFLLVSGYSRARLRAIEVISACARARLTPSFKRP